MDRLSVVAVDKLLSHLVLLELRVKTLQALLDRFDFIFIVARSSLRGSFGLNDIDRRIEHIRLIELGIHVFFFVFFLDELDLWWSHGGDTRPGFVFAETALGVFDWLIYQ